MNPHYSNTRQKKSIWFPGWKWLTCTFCLKKHLPIWQFSSYLIADLHGKPNDLQEEKSKIMHRHNIRKKNPIMCCFIKSKADNTENCQRPHWDLINHLVQSLNVRSELYCPALDGWNLIGLNINNESQILFLHLDFHKDLRNLREVARIHALCPIRIMLYRAHKKITFYSNSATFITEHEKQTSHQAFPKCSPLGTFPLKTENTPFCY